MGSLPRAFFGLVLLASAVACQAESCTELPASRSVPDGQGCLAAVRISDSQGAPRVVVALVHGDARGVLDQRQVDRWNDIGRSLAGQGRAVVFLVRPGYRSPAGDSSGYAHPRDDDYTALNVERLAQALRELRRQSGAQHVVLVGHSGGAALAALVLGIHPDAADGALLLACPCDLPPWREHRGRQRNSDQTWRRSLNPLDAVDGLHAGAPVHVAVGDRDDNTLPEFSRRWADAAAARGVPVTFELAPGHRHESLQHWSLLPRRLDDLLRSLAR